MRAKTYAKREFEALLKLNGYTYERCRGSHFIYKRGREIISIPKNLNKMIARRLIKEKGLMEVNLR